MNTVQWWEIVELKRFVIILMLVCCIISVIKLFLLIPLELVLYAEVLQTWFNLSTVISSFLQSRDDAILANPIRECISQSGKLFNYLFTKHLLRRNSIMRSFKEGKNILLCNFDLQFASIKKLVNFGSILLM